MRVGLSLLTLAPDDLGGTETYARQLVRALARIGTHDYVVLVPALAQDAAEGLPAIEVSDPPIARRGPLASPRWRSRRAARRESEPRSPPWTSSTTR